MSSGVLRNLTESGLQDAPLVSWEKAEVRAPPHTPPTYPLRAESIMPVEKTEGYTKTDVLHMSETGADDPKDMDATLGRNSWMDEIKDLFNAPQELAEIPMQPAAGPRKSTRGCEVGDARMEFINVTCNDDMHQLALSGSEVNIANPPESIDTHGFPKDHCQCNLCRDQPGL